MEKWREREREEKDRIWKENGEERIWREGERVTKRKDRIWRENGEERNWREGGKERESDKRERIKKDKVKYT